MLVCLSGDFSGEHLCILHVEKNAWLVSGYNILLDFMKGEEMAEWLSLLLIVTRKCIQLSVTNYQIIGVWGDIFDSKYIYSYFHGNTDIEVRHLSPDVLANKCMTVRNGNQHLQEI